MEDISNQHLRAPLLEVVENQLLADTPPEVRTTLDRLIASGHSRERAMALIASAVFTEMQEILRTGQPYVEARYVKLLRELR